MDKNEKCAKCGSTENLKKQYQQRKYIYYFCSPCKQDRMKKFYDKRKVMVFEHYGNKCNCCSETTFEFLTIDHINNDGHKEVWANGNRIGGVQLYQKIYKNNYPDTYQLLCMNCNFGKRMNGGVCPHKML